MWATIFFWILAFITVGSALLVVTNRNPVRSALFLVITFIAIAVYYITLSAQFIAAVQIIVYAGAIMVLFLFVIMLLNLGAPHALKESGVVKPSVAMGLSVVFLGLLIGSQSLLGIATEAASPAAYDKLGNVETVGLSLFDPKLPWLFPFEITSILLLVAIIGAIMMAKRRV